MAIDSSIKDVLWPRPIPADLAISVRRGNRSIPTPSISSILSKLVISERESVFVISRTLDTIALVEVSAAPAMFLNACSISRSRAPLSVKSMSFFVP